MSRRDERGVVLLAVLFFVVLASAGVATFLSHAVVDGMAASNRDAAARAEALARGGVRLAIAALLQDRLQEKQEEFEADTANDLWARLGTFPLPLDDGGLLQVRVEDAGARLSLNALFAKRQARDEKSETLLTELLTKVIEEIPVRPEQKLYDVPALAHNLIDWVDQDDVKVAGGEEHDYYQAQNPPYRAANLPLLSVYTREGIPIVGTSTSCILTLKEEAPELLNMDDEDSKLVARQTYDLAEFLLLLNDQGKLETNLHPIPMTLPYHIPCQYRAHRIGKPGLELLELIPDLNILQSNVACCGIAGTYGYKSEKYTIARQVGQPLFHFVEKIGGPFVLCESETCRWQISHATGVPAYHPVELLEAAYGLEIDGKLAEAIIGA